MSSTTTGLRFAALVRVSTEKQEDTGESLRTQRTDAEGDVELPLQVLPPEAVEARPVQVKDAGGAIGWLATLFAGGGNVPPHH